MTHDTLHTAVVTRRVAKQALPIELADGGSCVGQRADEVGLNRGRTAVGVGAVKEPGRRCEAARVEVVGWGFGAGGQNQTSSNNDEGVDIQNLLKPRSQILDH